MAGKNKGNSPGTPNSMMLRRTLFLAIVCGILAFAVLGLRLMKLQLIDHDFYEEMAIEGQLRDTKVTAERGKIYDRNMKILAMSASVYNVYISPAEINKYDIDEEKGITHEFIAESLAETLDVDASMILSKMEKSKSWYQTVALQVEPEVSDAVRELKNEYDLVGVRLEDTSKRYYPYSSLAAQLIGFVGTDDGGLAGLEFHYNEILTGTSGRKVRLTTAVGTETLLENYEYYYDSKEGDSLVISMDSAIQYYLEKHLEQAVQDYHVQNGAAAIAMNVDTGAVMGMVSLGNFDLNNYQIVSEEVQAEIDAEEDKEKKAELLSGAQQLQWRNKAISDTYEPGSTFKIITLAIALNEGIVSPDDHFYCGGSIDVPGRTSPVKCWKTQGHGDQTLLQALQHSCNVAFTKIGLQIGEETFFKYCEGFGLFESSEDKDAYLSAKTSIDLPGEARSIWWPYNVFCNPDNQSQLAAASFGQTFNITPLQLITAVSACCNGGYLMQPHSTEAALDAEGNLISATEPTVIRQVISEQTSELVCSMLEQVVGDLKEGTGRNAYVAGYRIGGKTGTSTKTTKEVTLGQKEYVVSFIGVAPMDDPKIAVLILLDNPSNSSGIYISGGQMAAPVVGKMFADILPYMGYEPVYSEEEERTVDHSVPNIGGMTISEAQSALRDAGFTYRIIGTGETVTNQLPTANSVIAAESQVIIYCGADPSEDMAIMPDVTGTTYSIARQQLGGKALFIRAAGGAITDPSLIVTQQSVKAGTPIDCGTVIEVTVSDLSNLGRY